MILGSATSLSSAVIDLMVVCGEGEREEGKEGQTTSGKKGGGPETFSWRCTTGPAAPCKCQTPVQGDPMVVPFVENFFVGRLHAL